jgi:hypothetical protein
MTQYSLTKSPNADNVVALSKNEGTPIEVTKNPGNDTVTFQKNASIKARIVKSGGRTFSSPPAVRGGILIWNNDMWSQERMLSVHRTGIRRNIQRY